MKFKVEFVGNLSVHNADRRASVQDELKVGLRSDSALHLDQVSGRESKGKFRGGNRL
jgi:hypothetical protein